MQNHYLVKLEEDDKLKYLLSVELLLQ